MLYGSEAIIFGQILGKLKRCNAFEDSKKSWFYEYYVGISDIYIEKNCSNL